MLGLATISRLTRRAEMVFRRRLVNVLVEGLLKAVLVVSCAVAAVVETSLITCVYFSKVKVIRSIDLLKSSVVPERAMVRIRVFLFS